MLVLTRRSQQSIMIGDEIVITVLEVRGDQVRIGVAAPRDVVVHREEVFAELAQANQSAASPSPEALQALGALLPSEQKPSEQKPSEQKPTEQKPSEQKPTEQEPAGQDEPAARARADQPEA